MIESKSSPSDSQEVEHKKKDGRNLFAIEKLRLFQLFRDHLSENKFPKSLMVYRGRALRYQATITIYNRTRSYPKPYRPTLGRRFEESILNVLLALRKAPHAS